MTHRCNWYTRPDPNDPAPDGYRHHATDLEESNVHQMTGTGSVLAGRYRLDRRIATGGMGVVWAATDELLGRQVAIKVVKPEYADDPAFRERLQAEARAAAAVHDPHVVAIYDVGESTDAGQIESFIVMELLAGESLAAELHRGPLPPDQVATLLADVGTALAAAHACGVVHRDIKPGNLMCEPSGRHVVLDFGIARAASAASLTATGVILGTARYLSPEQAAGHPAIAASDVYALGVVAHHCLSGAPPFDAESDVAIALAHLHDPVPPLPANVPGRLAALIESCLAKRPEERPSAADVATRARALIAARAAPDAAAPPGGPSRSTAAPLEPVTAGLEPVASAPATQERAPAWLGSRWLAVGAAAGLTLIAAVTALGIAANPADRAAAGNARKVAVQTSPPAAVRPVANRTVRIIGSRFVGKTWPAARAELVALGLQPRRRTAASGEPPGRVVRVSPTGLVAPGSIVTAWMAPAAGRAVTGPPPGSHAPGPKGPSHSGKPSHGPKPGHGPGHPPPGHDPHHH